MTAAMPKIGISYRHSDSSAMAGRIFDRLAANYGKDSVFMDVEKIPFGIDIRKHIESILRETDVLLVVIGRQWLEAKPTGLARIAQEADPVREEIELAFNQDVRIIPILIDGATMPTSTELPESLHDFAFLNAAEVAVGRDFHIHMDRLIAEIDRAAQTVSTISGASHPLAMQSGAGLLPAAGALSWPARVLWYFALPVGALLIVHHLIVDSYDLDTIYLRAVSFILPFCIGLLLFWRERLSFRTAAALGVAVGVAGAAGMTVLQSLNSGDPILPANRSEWRENIEYAVAISLSYIAAYVVVRALRSRLAGRWGSLAG